MAEPLTRQIEVSTYDIEANKTKTHKVTIRELLGGELRKQRNPDPDAEPVFVDEVLVRHGVPQDVVDGMAASEMRRVMNEIWDLSGFAAAEVKDGPEDEPQGNS